MHPHSYVAIVTCLALLTYIWIGLGVAQARGKSGISAPQMTGDPILERNVRAHYNTLEWLPVFLVSLWLFAIYWQSDLLAAGLGLVWIVARILYARGYVADPAKRSLGFLLQAAVCAILLFGALGRVVWVLVTVGA